MAEAKMIDRHLVADIAKSYVSHNSVAASDLPNLIAVIHRSLAGLGERPQVPETLKPAVAIRRSYDRDFVVCLDCGWHGKMLRRHLGAAHGLSPEEYRARWGLKNSHPITAPGYSEGRSTLARKLGLGRRYRLSSVAPEPGAREPRRRGRPRRTPQPA